jgi:hypothetical protein
MGFALFPLTWWDLTETPDQSMRRLLDALDERRSQLGLAI